MTRRQMKKTEDEEDCEADAWTDEDEWVNDKSSLTPLPPAPHPLPLSSFSVFLFFFLVSSTSSLSWLRPIHCLHRSWVEFDVPFDGERI